MKKIISLFCILVSISFMFSLFNISYADCKVSDSDIRNQELWTLLDNCLSWSDLVNPGDGLIEWGVKEKIVYWTGQLARLLGLLAVGAIVYGALMMTISWGEDEKIKKWKDIVKWSMLWFLALLVSGGLVRIVIELIFSVAW